MSPSSYETAEKPIKLLLNEPEGREAASAPPQVVVEFRGKSPYDNHADEFIRPVAVSEPAGGEMSGPTAHFLFGAKAAPTQRHNPGQTLRQQDR